MSVRRRSLVAVACATAAATTGWLALARGSSTAVVQANTKIEHLVVIFDENESFDHYFATYPGVGVNTAQNAGLLPPNNNPNSSPPALLTRAQALTCDQNHNYANEQAAFNSGLMDKFPENTGGGSCADRGIVMNYFDGTTVTALWNLAQGFAMSDNFYGSTFGPSTP